MLCTVTDIRGDYAYVRYDDTGVVSEVAIALLTVHIGGICHGITFSACSLHSTI